jgi:diaminopimelate epimerase
MGGTDGFAHRSGEFHRTSQKAAPGTFHQYEQKSGIAQKIWPRWTAGAAWTAAAGTGAALATAGAAALTEATLMAAARMSRFIV